jgi:site-specific DNA recombinase
MGIMEAHKEGKTPALCYDRVSTAGQAGDGFSLEYQEQYAKLYSESNGLYIVYNFNVTESAWKKDRKHFRIMFDKAKQYGIKNIIFKNTDRMSRNHHDLSTVEELIDREGFIIHFFQDNRKIDAKSNHNERFILSINLAVAKQMGDKARHDALASHEYKAKKGIFPMRPPMGYKYDLEKKTHYIDPDKESTMRFIFDSFDFEHTGISIREFRDIINDKGFRSPTGKLWSTAQLHHILSNPFYHGEFRFRDQIWPGTHQPYYQKDRYIARVERMHVKYNNNREGRHDFILAGFLKYGKHILTGEIKKQKYVYYTSRYVKVSFREDAIFEEINQEFFDLVLGDQIYDYLKQSYIDTVMVSRKKKEREGAVISRKIAELEQKKGKMIMLLVDDEIDKQGLRIAMDDINAELKHLEEERHRVNIDYHKYVQSVEETIYLIKTIPGHYKLANAGERVKLLKSMASSIEINKEGKIHINWKKPFSFILNDDILPIIKDQKVRTYPIRLPESDMARTVEHYSYQWVIYIAA